MALNTSMSGETVQVFLHLTLSVVCSMFTVVAAWPAWNIARYLQSESFTQE